MAPTAPIPVVRHPSGIWVVSQQEAGWVATGVKRARSAHHGRNPGGRGKSILAVNNSQHCAVARACTGNRREGKLRGRSSLRVLDQNPDVKPVLFCFHAIAYLAQHVDILHSQLDEGAWLDQSSNVNL
jgi:hypothetical protein